MSDKIQVLKLKFFYNSLRKIHLPSYLVFKMFSSAEIFTGASVPTQEGFVKSKYEKKKERKEKKYVDITSEILLGGEVNFIGEHKQIAPLAKKTVVCKSVKEGVPCTYGNKCNFSHYVDEINPANCPFGDECFRIKYGEKGVKNANVKNGVCFNIHPDESISIWLQRNGFDESKMQRPAQDPSEFKFTRMCISVIENIPCAKGDECTYAHKVEDLKTNPCNFGVDCHHIRKDGDEYVNNNTNKICIFIHPDESLKNYESRALRIMADKKRKSVEDINTKKSKKPRFQSEEFPAFGMKQVQPEFPATEVEPKKVEESSKKPVADKIIINVPSHMAVEMLQMLMMNGKTNVELNTY